MTTTFLDSKLFKEIEKHKKLWNERFRTRYKGCGPNDGKSHSCFCYGACQEIIGYYDRKLHDDISIEEASKRFTDPNSTIPFLDNIKVMVDRYTDLTELWKFYKRQDRENFKYESDKLSLDKLFIDRHFEILKNI